MKSTAEREWHKKFYEGTFLIKGWKARTKEILRGTPTAEKEELRALLEELGEKIGGEWCKDNSVRKIDTEMLKKWGDEMVTAKKGGPEALVKKIQGIQEEVDEIV